MDRTLLIRLGLTALLILAYVVVAALEISTGLIAPIIVIAIALILFVPMGRKGDRKR